MFIVKKKIHGKEYYYLNETKRVEGKVVSKCIAYLGKDRKGAEKKAKTILNERKHDNKMEILDEEKTKLVKKDITIDDLTTYCKRKGFVFRSSEAYGGFSGFWDYGPLGVELYNNIKQDFWKFFVQSKDNIVGIEASIISNPKIWKASGHLASFSDTAVICKKCKNSTKIDKSELGRIKCEKCGGEFEAQGEFNLLFKTNVGALNPVEAYLRGETAQGMFVDFKLAGETSRMQLPFGIAQVGKCFRNEIAPRDFLFRSREFTIGEFEFFINPEEKMCDLLSDVHKNIKIKFLDAETQEEGKNNLRNTSIGEIVKEGRLEEWHAYWLAEQLIWFERLGILENIKVREHIKGELSHYSSATFDLDFEFPFGSKEIAGNSNRGQYDLSQHMNESKENFELYDEKYKKKVIPKVIEPTFGIERIFLALICNSYYYDEERQNIVLLINPRLSPVKASVFPIVKNEEFEKVAENIYKGLKEDWKVMFDNSGSIGRRYSRADEIGVPMCITVDEQTLKDKTITIRWRDNAEQVIVKIRDLKEIVRKVINGEDLFKFGKVINTRKKI